jgi:hypothetical protein
MELFMDVNTAERIAWGLLSFITLIVYLRWVGPWEDQKKDEPSQEPKEIERQAETSRSIVADYLAVD